MVRYIGVRVRFLVALIFHVCFTRQGTQPVVIMRLFRLSMRQRIDVARQGKSFADRREERVFDRQRRHRVRPFEGLRDGTPEPQLTGLNQGNRYTLSTSSCRTPRAVDLPDWRARHVDWGDMSDGL